MGSVAKRILLPGSYSLSIPNHCFLSRICVKLPTKDVLSHATKMRTQSKLSFLVPMQLLRVDCRVGTRVRYMVEEKAATNKLEFFALSLPWRISTL